MFEVYVHWLVKILEAALLYAEQSITFLDETMRNTLRTQFNWISHCCRYVRILSVSIDSFTDLFDDADATRIWDMLHRPIFVHSESDVRDAGELFATLLIQRFDNDSTVAREFLIQMAQIQPH
jgi:hypothetical protein